MSTSENGHIYLIRNSVNGKGYIGQTTATVAKRFNQHVADAKRGSKFAIHEAIRKYGAENFTVETVITCDKFLLNKLEPILVVHFGTKAQVAHGYNMAEGGHGSSGWNHSEATKSKMSATMRGRTQSAEHIRKAAAGKVGRKQSEATKAKISAWNQRNKLNAQL